MGEKLACDKLKKEFAALEKIMNSHMKGPLTLLNAAEKLVNAATDLAMDMFENMLDLFSFPDGGYLDGLLDSLKRLRSCLYLAGNSEYTAILDGAIAVLDGGGDVEDLPGDFMSTTKGDFQDKVKGIVDGAAQGSILGKLQAIEGAYQNMLKQSGIYEYLGLLDTIIDCMTMVCDDAVEYGGKVDGMYEKLKIDGDGFAKPDFANSEKIDGVKKEAIGQANTAVKNAKDAIDSVPWF